MNARMMTRAPLEARIDTLDWPALTGRLAADGFARLPSLLDAEECASCSGGYADATTAIRYRR
jgi:hypothetical protein